MTGRDFGAFQRFVKAKRSRFKAIARKTANEHAPEDIENLAWIKAFEVAEKLGISIDFDDPFFQDRVVAFLYSDLVNFSEKTVRKAVKLDQQIDGEDVAAEDHIVMRKLAASDFCDPLQQLLAAEDAAEAPREHAPHESRAGAYIHLLRRFDNKMRAVAHHLLISPSYCYFRYNEALAMARWQLSLPGAGLVTDSAKCPKSWRAFRQMRRWAQMELDLSYTLSIIAPAE